MDRDCSNILSSAEPSLIVWSSDLWVPILDISKFYNFTVFSCSLSNSALCASTKFSNFSLFRYFCLICCSSDLISSANFSFSFFFERWVERSAWESLALGDVPLMKFTLMSVEAVILTVEDCLSRSVLPLSVGRFEWLANLDECTDWWIPTSSKF